MLSRKIWCKERKRWCDLTAFQSMADEEPLWNSVDNIELEEQL